MIESTTTRGTLRTRWFQQRGVLSVVLVYALLVLAMGLLLRVQLREQLLTREATAFQDIVDMHAETLLADAEQSEMLGSSEAAFSVFIQASRLRGVVALRVYDGAGQVQESMPIAFEEASIDKGLLAEVQRTAQAGARFHPKGQALSVLLGEGVSSPEGGGVPLLEVVVPCRLLPGPDGLPLLGHYWMDGEALSRGFAALDAKLWLQGGMAFLAGSVLLGLSLGWAFRKLERAHAALRESHADLSKANAELALSARLSALGTISAHLMHDLKNPLLGLESFIQENQEGSPGDGTAWAEARETARRLSRLVSETMEVLRARGSQGKGGGDQALPVMELLEAEVSQHRQRAAGCSIQLSTTKEADLVMPASTAVLVPLILRTLLDNAVEATRSGGLVTVTAVLEEGQLRVRVSDEGPGLSESLCKSVFSPVESSKVSGSGLGLALARQLARLAGGSLTLESTGPQGTCMVLHVPVPGGASGDVGLRGTTQ